MLPIQRLLLTGLVLVNTGCLIGCSGNGSNQESLPSLPQSTSLRLQPISTSLSSPVFMTAPADGTNRLFIVEQGGLIRIFDVTTGSLLGTPFLDISGLISTGGERGLLGLTLDPQYNTNLQFYVFYTNTSGIIVIARYRRDAANTNLADASSATLLLAVAHPNFSNHNGGMLAFGPDGCLYAGVGDGGGAGDPNNNAQSLSSLLGKLLRLDPSTGLACSNVIINPFNFLVDARQVWSLGLRNPWRFSFYRITGDLYIGDVGQSAREEIDVAVAPNAGRQANYGWRLMEGFLCFNASMNCNSGSLTLPVLDYPHLSGACSVTGGYAYRGSALAVTQGTYFYGDFCAGFVKSFRYQNGQPTEQTEWPLLSPPGDSITSFGEDAGGELYVLSQRGGLFKVIPN
jgi:hypothetical protein